ncbi:MAG: hypothetical protein ABIP48_15850 [Planctomycetota bacterium]
MLGIIVVGVIMPFATRDDWIGWVALLMIAAFTIALWALLISGLARSMIEWWRNQSGKD